MQQLAFAQSKRKVHLSRCCSIERDMIRTGVVGLGHCGYFHAKQYASLPGSHLVAVADRHLQKAAEAGQEYDALAFADHRDLIGLVDAVSVAAPAGMHHPVVRDFLEAGIHVLVEKPIAETVGDAEELVRLAQKNGVVLQVGHLERFNPAFRALPEHLRAPDYIEAHRLTRFRGRGDDVSVVLDLMIHDIDLVHALVPSPVIKVQAKGLSVYSNALDLVNAVIHFQCGAIANLTASRASIEPERKLHLFQHHAYTCLDMYRKSIVTQVQRGDGRLDINEVQPETCNALGTELAAFLAAVKSGDSPPVTGQDGLRALDMAIRVADAVELTAGSTKPLPVQQTAQAFGSYVTHDYHPETRDPFFSRTSLVNWPLKPATTTAATGSAARPAH